VLSSGSLGRGRTAGVAGKSGFDADFGSGYEKASSPVMTASIRPRGPLERGGLDRLRGEGQQEAARRMLR